MRIKQALRVIVPGILVAGTGVGAGDLATGAFTGHALGVAVLWAVLVGAFLKFVLNEGLARWQLATGTTLLEGCIKHLGRPFRWLFLCYLAVWSFLVGVALMSACGATMHAVVPLWSAPVDKVVYGIAHSLFAVLLISIGGFKLFEKVMSVCIGIMFVVVVVIAVMLRPEPAELLSGLFVPRIPKWDAGGVDWTVALLGGVGGTLTVLCYGYWIREEGRVGSEQLQTCRIDLAAGYFVTALFGLSMVVIGSRLPEISGKGAGLLADIANRLVAQLGTAGPVMKWLFLVGAWGAVFSSLLGVWQSIPYLFADFLRQTRASDGLEVAESIDTKSRAYRVSLLLLAFVPMLGLWFISFQVAQKAYAIVGAIVIPALSVILLILNNRETWVGAKHRNHWTTNAVLIVTITVSAYAGWLGIRAKFF